MITRPMALLVVIGDDVALNKDKDENWPKFIEYCVNNGGFFRNGRKGHKRVQFP